MKKYQTDPPQLGLNRKLGESLLLVVRSVFRLIWQPLFPFKTPSVPNDSFSELQGEASGEQVEMCMSIFQQAESRRTHLEQKAQWAFALVVVVVPVLGSVSAYLLGKSTNESNLGWAEIFLFASALILALGFLSALRAVMVRERQMLFIGGVVSESEGKFEAYSQTTHAKGLLFCASFNEAVNDHIAQFVKGAQLLTALAVFALLIALIPISLSFHKDSNKPSKTQIVGAVGVDSAELAAIRKLLEELNDALAKRDLDPALSNRIIVIEQELDQLRILVNNADGASQPSPTPRLGTKSDE